MTWSGGGVEGGGPISLCMGCLMIPVITLGGIGFAVVGVAAAALPWLFSSSVILSWAALIMSDDIVLLPFLCVRLRALRPRMLLSFSDDGARRGEEKSCLASSTNCVNNDIRLLPTRVGWGIGSVVFGGACCLLSNVSSVFALLLGGVGAVLLLLCLLEDLARLRCSGRPCFRCLYLFAFYKFIAGALWLKRTEKPRIYPVQAGSRGQG